MKVLTRSGEYKTEDSEDKYAFLSQIGEPVHSRGLIVKRGLDFVFGVIFLMLSVPVLIVFGILVKLTSKGPVFYKQRRVGLCGKTFNIIKLRSMKQDAEKVTGAVWAQKNDPRVTKIGRFMRRTRIDELPQFWNVVVGDMSLVGPRPERPGFTEEFTKKIPFFPQRLRIKPGITGYAQVHGGYDITPEKKAKLDNIYIKHFSLMTDVKVIVDTIHVVFTGEGSR